MARSSLSKILILLLSAISVAFNNEIWTSSNFENKVREHGSAFVKFFAPWCGHCKRLAPDWEKLAQDQHFLKVVKVDCTADGKEICGKYGVTGYPTLKYFSVGADGELESENYEGARSFESLMTYVETKSLPAYVNASTDQIKECLKPNRKPCLIGFFNNEDSPLLQKLKSESSSLRDLVSVIYTVDPKEAATVSQKAESIVFYREKFMQSKLQNAFRVIPETGNIKRAVLESLHGTVGFRCIRNEKTFKQPLLIVYYDTDPEKDPSSHVMLMNRMIKNLAQFDVALAISKKSEYEGEVSELPTYSSSFIGVILRPDLKRYLMNQHFGAGEVTNFVKAATSFLQDYKDNKLSIHIKSAPEPTLDHGAVKVVVGTSFEKIVMDETKDVLIEMYAPWCGHCKQLEPKYEQLAKKLQGNPDLVIAKMDATANDSPPEYPVKGFPTIFFAPKGRKHSPIQYDGDREVDAFVKWLNARVATPLKIDPEVKTEL